MTTASHSNLGRYLTDHHSGSVAAIALLSDLDQVQEMKCLQEFCTHLKLEIESDQAVLHRLIALLGVEPTMTQQCGAWIAEKVAALRIRWLPDSTGALGLMEAFEILALGIEGKRLLWRALSYTVGSEEPFRDFDFATLSHRASVQIALVEKWRIEMARAAFSADPSSNPFLPPKSRRD